MAWHTTFRFCLDPTVKQYEVLARHAGASRFAFNQCLGIVKTALTQPKTDAGAAVPWTGLDLINAFNTWKKTQAAGRVFTVDADAVADTTVTGLAWRGEVPSFRLPNKHPKGTPAAIGVGDNNRSRSVTLAGIGSIRVHDDTRRLRRLLTKNRAKILFATISHRAGRWWISLNVEAADLHINHQHRTRPDDRGGWVGVDRGLSELLVAATADGTEVTRISDAPKALAAGLKHQRRLAKSLSRKKKGSQNRKDAAARLGRHHHHIANLGHHFLHQVSGELVKTHDRLVIENLNVAAMLANHRLARAISDASWAEFARLVKYKQAWRHGQLRQADRWYPSTRLCPLCGTVNNEMTLADRVFTCGCGHADDRDPNAAVNLAQWGHTHQHETSTDPRTPKQPGRATKARRPDGADQHPRVGETSPHDAGTDVHTAPAA